MISSAHFALFVILGVAAVVSSFRWSRLWPADKWICALLWLTILQEAVALHLNLKHQNNFPTYHIYSPIELSFLTMMFFQSHHKKVVKRLVMVVGLAGLSFGIVNTVWLQNLSSPNTYFLLSEATIILVFCMTSVFAIALDENAKPFRMMQFWMTLGLLVYWSVTFASYGMFSLLTIRNTPLAIAVRTILQGANLLFYAEVAGLFLLYPKLIPSGARQ